MNDKPVVLLVEDSPDAASEFKDEIKKQIDLQVIVAAPFGRSREVGYDWTIK